MGDNRSTIWVWWKTQKRKTSKSRIQNSKKKENVDNEFICAINCNDKKILYLIKDKKKDNRKDMTN